MKKVTDFIVNKRHLILFIFIILTCFSGIISMKVEINSDMTRYLPSDSETKIGMNIMESEFKEADEGSSLNIMFEGLSNNEKLEIYEELKTLKNVESVNYNESDKYNKNKYTLYQINIDKPADSKVSEKLYNTIKEKYKDYEIYLSGGVADANTPILPMWIMVVSITSALIILIIMCDSYFEPFLFLAVILMAVILNSGTNIIFNNVSEVTNSISAILQMALSMDYSIMLISRFREESSKEKDKVKAMKEALYHSFQAIMSSSLTTIVGLITLIFMSFTIGRDLGLVLAKGVLLSLISIFFCLPTLILMFESFIIKTEKKTLNIKLNLLGKISYKLKYPLTFIFVLIFIGSYFLKGNLEILYTSSEKNKISEVFGNTNQIVGIYDNKYEDKIYEYISELKENEKITSVLSYSNTLNEKLKYNEIKTKIKSLSDDLEINIDENLLKIIYYKYYNKEINNKLTIKEFIETLENQIDDTNIKNELYKLTYFTNAYEINKQRTSTEIPRILGIKKEDIDNLLILYNSKYNNVELTIHEFVEFIKNDLSTNENYKSNLDENLLEKLNIISIFSSPSLNEKSLSSEELCNLFNIDENLIKEILLLKYITVNDNTKLSIPEFINSIILLKYNTNFLDNIDITELEKLFVLTKNENNLLTTKLDKANLSTLFGSELVDNYYLMNNLTNTDLFTPVEFINEVLNSDITNLLTPTELQKLNLLKLIMGDTLSANPKLYTSEEISVVLNLNASDTIKLYALINYTHGNTSNWNMTPLELINIILANKENPEIGNALNEEVINNLILLKNIMENSTTKYNANDMSNLLGLESERASLIYSLYNVTYISPSSTISLNTLVNFILKEVLTDANYKNLINQTNQNKLKAINNMMYSSLNNSSHNTEEIYNLFSALSDNIDENTVKLLFIYHGSMNAYNNNWKLTIEELMNFLNKDIINNEIFKSFIPDNLKTDISSSNSKIEKSKKLLVGENYSRILINTEYEPESEETFNFLKELKKYSDEDLKIYLVGDSMVAYEMSESFVKEFNFISILTMIFIFIVVTITFKSLIIPFILVLLIQSAVYLTMGILSLAGMKVYFIAILVVQSILMGATIDYAILYTSYYLENRAKNSILTSIINSYNSSIHTILTSASILIIVTFILGIFSSGITSIICKTIAEGTLCSSLLILIILPGVLAGLDKIIIKNK